MALQIKTTLNDMTFQACYTKAVYIETNVDVTDPNRNIITYSLEFYPIQQLRIDNRPPFKVELLQCYDNSAVSNKLQVIYDYIKDSNQFTGAIDC